MNAPIFWLNMAIFLTLTILGSFFILKKSASGLSIFKYLGWIFVIGAFIISLASLRLFMPNIFKHIHFVENTVDILYGPLFYIYIRLNLGYQTNKKYLHFLLPIALFSFCLFLLLFHSGLSTIIFSFYSKSDHEGAQIIRYGVYTNIIGYQIRSMYEIIRYGKKFFQGSSLVSKVRYRWAFYFVILNLMLFSSTFALELFHLEIYNSYIFIASYIIVFMLVYQALNKPLFFHDLKELREYIATSHPPKMALTNQMLKERINDYMYSKKPFLNKDLTINKLSETIGVSRDELSDYIRYNLKMNFFEFINQYRIEEAKKKLKDWNYKQYTVNGIAEISGFSSRTTFYEAFKKYTGQTPSEFIRNK